MEYEESRISEGSFFIVFIEMGKQECGFVKLHRKNLWLKEALPDSGPWGGGRDFVQVCADQRNNITSFFLFSGNQEINLQPKFNNEL